MLIGYAVSWAPIPIMPLSPSDPPFFGDGERGGDWAGVKKAPFFAESPSRTEGKEKRDLDSGGADAVCAVATPVERRRRRRRTSVPSYITVV